jgi:hypothetical protein
MAGKYPAAFVLSSIKAPTLCVEGTLDRMCNSGPIVQGIKGAK